MNESLLEKQLAETSFPELFLRGDFSKADQIWESGKNRAALEAILVSATAADYVKFLTAELLRKKEAPLKKEISGILAGVYATALKNSTWDAGNTFQLNGNVWGFLYEQDDAGHLGKQLVSFGEAAVPHLIALLNDAGRVLYEGSQEATIGNAYQYRIKDFAAFYISKITNIPVPFHQEIEKRDEEIERLKTILNQ